MHDLFQVDDIWIVTKLLKNSDFSDGCTWDTVIAVVDLDLLNCNDLVSAQLSCHIYNTVCTLAKL